MRAKTPIRLALSALIGLGVAALLLTVFPELRGASQQKNAENWPSGDIADVLTGSPVSYSHAVSRAAPSVVNIYTRKITRNPADHPLAQHPLFGRLVRQVQIPQTSLGSGVIVRTDGTILTNHHVIAGAEKILVMLYDGRTAPVTLIGSDPDTDLAVLKINIDNLQPISMGDSNGAKIGDIVLAIGNPHGIGQTVTQGIISATGRAGLGLNTFENFLQTDAGITAGNSGGALVDVRGNLLGINTASLGNTGSISFAIPSATAQQVLQEVLEYGFVIRGWLGLDAIPVTPRLARQLNLPLRNGLVIRAIARGGPTDNLNLYAGDIVIAIDQNAVIDPQSSMTQIAEVKPGTPIVLDIWRRGETLSITAIAGTRPKE